MRRFFASLIVAVGLIAAPGLAYAEWRWTQWDMPVDQVVAGSDGALTRQAPRDGAHVHRWDMLANGRLAYEGFLFNAEFYFDAAGNDLKVIRLSLVDPRNCAALEAFARETYGTPEDKSVSMGALQMKSLVWADDGDGNFLGLTATNAIGDTPPLCFLRFRPINYTDGPA